MKPTTTAGEVQYKHSHLIAYGDLLRTGTIQERIYRFYAAFGARKPDSEKFTVWPAQEVAVVIGLPASDTKSAGRRVSVERNKMIQNGLLVKVESDRYYSYYAVPQPACQLDDAAWEILNNRASYGGNVAYGTPGRIVVMKNQGRVKMIPHVLVMPKLRLPPELLDFSDERTWEFWTNFFPNILDSNKHPLAGHGDMRYQAAWAALHLGLAESYFDDPWKFSQTALSKWVGREDKWAAPAAADVARHCMKLPQDQTVAAVATRWLNAQLQPEL